MALEGKQFRHYRILYLIGEGGMGKVYLVEDLRVKRQLAAKFIRMEAMLSDQEARDQALRHFWREATAIAQFDHPGILPLYEHGEAVIDEMSLAYLLMPYRPEGSLVAWLRRRTQQAKPLTTKHVAHVIAQASQSLQHAHDHRVMHLDIKPANFLIRSQSADDEYPDLQLSDFGIARLESATESLSQQVRGTPTYMAPEQSEGHPEYASDQYALAIMAYELLTGGPPFRGRPLSVMFAHAHTPPRPVYELNPLLSSAVDAVLQRALAKKPEERFVAVSAFAQALQDALPRGADMPTQVHPTTSPPPLPASDTLASALSPQSAPFMPTPETSPLQDRATLPPVTSLALAPSNPVFLASSTVAAAPVRSKHRRSSLLVALVLVVLLSFLSAGSLGVYQVVRGIQNGQGTATALSATAQAHKTATALTLATGKRWYIQHAGPPELRATSLRAVAWSGSLYVAVAAHYGPADGTIFTSRDGRTWSAGKTGVNENLSGITWAHSWFVAVGDHGTILTSPDGHVWTTQHHDAAETFYDVTWSGSLFVVVGQRKLGTGKSSAVETILTSSDGHTWPPQNLGDQSNVNDGSLFGVTRSGSLFVAVGHRSLLNNTYSDTIVTSSDGSTWSFQTFPGGRYEWFSAVAWSGSLFVVVGTVGSDPLKGFLLTSPDGHVWTPQTSFSKHPFSYVIWAGWQFIVVGWDGAIFTSPDGHVWTFQKLDTTEILLGIVWSGSQLVVVGQHGTILTSP
jgi:serine/threonine protein kinase